MLFFPGVYPVGCAREARGLLCRATVVRKFGGIDHNERF